MRAQQSIAAFVALLVLSTGAGAAAAAAPTAGGATATAAEHSLQTPVAGQSSVPVQSTAPGQARPQQTTRCDYPSLYNQTVDGVVAIRTGSGEGSGFAYRTYRDNGTSYIVTNAHVVENYSSVSVQFSAGESVTGDVVGKDVYSDLAVVRVNKTPDYVDALDVAESSTRPGTYVAAIGNPFGLEETITHGIVSGVNRSMPTNRGFTIPDVVQTDAAINPGNSGGPLVTCNGTVLGVNTAGIAAARANNIGFAISSSVIRQVVPSLISTGEYSHAYLGVRVAPLVPAVVQANDLKTTQGVYVDQVVSGGPASGALRGSTGTKTVNGTTVPVGGDVIVAANGHPITSNEDLAGFLLTQARPGDTVTLTVVRNGRRQQVKVTLGTRPQPSG
ncbi:MAG: S1C family serine protease [Salinigranum sp.]